MFGLIYHVINLQRLGLYAWWQYYRNGNVEDSLVSRCKDEIVLSGYVITKLCQWMLPHLQILYDVDKESWFKILEGVYEDCYIHSDQFTKDRFYSSFNVPFDSLYEIEPPFNVSRPALFAAAAAIKDTAWLNKEIRHIKKWSKIFYDTFKELNIHTNKTSVNFSLINFDRVKKTSKQVFYALAKAGILLRQMNVYSIKNSLRVTVGNSKENLKLIVELKKILNV